MLFVTSIVYLLVSSITLIYDKIPLLKPFLLACIIFNSLLLGIQIPLGSETVGGGFIIKHYSNIAVNKNAIIGNNCTLFHGVTIGMEFCGRKKVIQLLVIMKYYFLEAKLLVMLKLEIMLL